MRNKSLLALSLGFLFSGSLCLAQNLVLYKQVDTIRLYLEIHYPEKIDCAKKYPAMVFFFGGGWKNGGRHHFRHHADYLAKRGMVCFLADYRTESKHQTSPFAALRDAKSAIRFIRKNAVQFGTDPSRIVASGGSAGGHLAAATAIIHGYDEDTEDLTVSCVPNALVLFNPVIDNGPAGYGYERVGDEYKDFSPLHNISKGTPPAIIFLGTNDHLVPVETAEYFKMGLERLGSRCDLELYEGAGHGFFNYRNFEYYRETLLESDRFLQSLGYLGEEPLKRDLIE